MEGVSHRLLEGPLAASLGFAYLLLLAAWVPQYLSWPWWNDIDHFATFAMAWDAGVLPYRDLPTFQFPGEYYFFWLVGRAFGWGRTAPVYAVDATLLALYGVALTAWSRRLFGRALPGVAGYGLFLGYYLGLGIEQVAQRDWHSAFLAVLGLFALQSFPGRTGRAASALFLAASFSIRPHVLMLVPAFMLAIDGSVRPPGGAWGPTLRAAVGWGGMLGAFLVLAFVPLALVGTLDDFVRGLREVVPGSDYNRLTVSAFPLRLFEQCVRQIHVEILAAVLAWQVTRGASERRVALTWLAAFAGAWIYWPLSPVPHFYLNHTLVVMSSVVAAVLVQTVLVARGSSPNYRLLVVALVAYSGFARWPEYIDYSMSYHVMTVEKSFEFPRRSPRCGRMGYMLYTWDEYRDLILYLRAKVPPGVRIANVLLGLPAVTGPVGRMPALPGESLAWFQWFRARPELEDAYIRSLRDTPDSVVIWKPDEERLNGSLLPRRLLSFIKSNYQFEARFGTIEVWRRRAAGSGSVRP